MIPSVRKVEVIYVRVISDEHIGFGAAMEAVEGLKCTARRPDGGSGSKGLDPLFFSHHPVAMKRTALTRRTAIRPKGWNKYGAIRTRDPLDISRSFDSKGEAERGATLRLLQRAGEISDLQFQVTFHLTAAAIGYRADFVYTEKGRMVAEDFKGVETERFQIICRLWRHYGPCLLRVTKRARGGRGFRVAKEIMPLPRNGVLALE